MDEKRRQDARNRRRMQLDESSSSDGNGQNNSNDNINSASQMRFAQQAASDNDIFIEGFSQSSSSSAAFGQPKRSHMVGDLDFARVNRNVEQMTKESAKGGAAADDLMSMISGGSVSI